MSITLNKAKQPSEVNKDIETLYKEIEAVKADNAKLNEQLGKLKFMVESIINLQKAELEKKKEEAKKPIKK